MKKHIINRRYRFVWGIFIGLVYLLSPISLFADVNFTREVDSLRNILAARLSPQVTLPVLFRLYLLHEHKSDRATYLKMYIKEAESIDSIPAVYLGANELAVHYFDHDHLDSVAVWSNFIDSVAGRYNEYPNALFNVKALLCQDLLSQGNYEQAMNDAIDLYHLAKEVNQDYGLARCSECLGLTYRNIYRDSDAVVSFQEGLDRLNLMGGFPHMRIRLVVNQIECCLRTDMYERVPDMLALYRSLIEEQMEQNKIYGGVYLPYRDYWMLYSFYTNYYILKDEKEKARGALEKADLYESKLVQKDRYDECISSSVKALYYEKNGNDLLALQYIDKYLEVDFLPMYVLFKGNILKKQGRIDEALKLYEELYVYSSRLNDEMFMRQINQLRTLYDLSLSEKQDIELKMNKQRMDKQQQRLFFIYSSIVILALILYVLYLYIRRTQRLRHALQEEKDALLKSEQQLVVEKQKAEEASRMKSAFVANMSHEIRTPLNAIVGFSGLLSDEGASQEEKEEYSLVIQNNTDLMLTLLKDVLDLSRMESDDMVFNFQRCSLEACCQNAVHSVLNYVPRGVRMTFTPAPEHIMVNTDSLRLQQLLTNLLTNSCKFTENGEINLSYLLEEDRMHVRIMVTDTGSGIPLEKQSAIFKRFEKLDDYKPGTGLGLSICNIIAKRLGGPGSIFLDTTYTGGARFVFVHPCEKHINEI